MACASSQLVRLLGFRQTPCTSFSSALTAATSSTISAKAGHFPTLSPLPLALSINLTETNRRNSAALRCCLTFVAKDESAASTNTALEENNRVVSEEDTTNASGDGDTADIRLFQSTGSSLKAALKKYASFVSLIHKLLRDDLRRRRIWGGVLVNTGLITFLVLSLLALDWYSWKTLGLPLKPFHFTSPFLISAALAGFAGFLYIPIVDNMKVHQILRQEGPSTHSSKRKTPTMGGLFFVPVGIAVARHFTSSNSLAVYGAILATLAFAAIGFVDDLLSRIKSHNYGLPGWVKLSLQVAVGLCFSIWLDSASISLPWNMNLSAHLPRPFGPLYLGKYYLALTAFCFAAMGNGVNLTDGLDGLAGGVAAWAFIGMSMASIAISPDLAVFGASMSGACVGFLFHNRYKASIFMGDTGSLALGGALAAMASLTGMFFPLFISSGVIVMEVLSVILQVLSVKITRKLHGVSRRVFRMAPIHHHFELCGIREPIIVASAYFLSSILALIAGCTGFILI
ncbi:hypothetical protein HPP92_021321 [Vanilla planifolia]|uniref:Phospho-N-acetylmuramoyl-pentapeptide-transferase n=1 Tax=Vanilla planifolia TaxID=51239 RepID=A0A835Q0V9_VANPL|nr:hypothetical protein HPP92_021321 [Vanilla planifolia]